MKLKDQPSSSDLAKSRQGNGLRAIPSVDRVMAHPSLSAARAQLPHGVIVAAVRAELESIRGQTIQGPPVIPNLEDIAEQAAQRARTMTTPSLHAVINATGVVLHTNLGRAPLSRQAQEAIIRAASYSNLEYDLEAGERGSRYTHAVDLLRQVVGCEDAVVVNNNAAALVLVLSTLSAGKEAIVSRGQLVEIGGGFRIPQIMEQSGARLVEVGTTNRTYIQDYSDAIGPETAILMRIHASNFRVIGFTVSPSVEDIVTLAHERDLMMVDDIGSGALLDTTRFGLSAEPTVQASLQAGADLILFSGDKLLGGPQSGIIVGKQAAVSRLKKHPLARALRVDKLTLSALEATLLHYLKGEAEKEVPVWRMISMSGASLKEKAESWAERLSDAGIACQVEQGVSAIGGGSLPGETLATWLVSINPGALSTSALATALRRAANPVIARVEHGMLLLDPRTVLEDQEEMLLAQVVSAAKPQK